MSKPYESFAQFVEKYEPLVWKISRSFASDLADRDDLAQEIFVSLWAASESMPSDVKELTFVYRVALNRAISWQRKEKTYARHLKSMFAFARAESKPETPGKLDDLDLLFRAIQCLSESDRSLILMHLDRCSYSEMVVTLGLNETTVAKRLSRAKLRLAEITRNLEKQDEL